MCGKIGLGYMFVSCSSRTCHPFGVPFCAVICYTGVYTPAWRISPRLGPCAAPFVRKGKGYWIADAGTSAPKTF